MIFEDGRVEEDTSEKLDGVAEAEAPRGKKSSRTVCIIVYRGAKRGADGRRVRSVFYMHYHGVSKGSFGVVYKFYCARLLMLLEHGISWKISIHCPTVLNLCHKRLNIIPYA